MSTVSVVATVEASNVPPRVRLDVTDTGTPNLFSTTVTRLNPDGTTVNVRTSDGNPLTLSTSGTNRVGLLYDYEMPFQQSVTYSTVETPGSSSAAVTVPESRVWLIHPGIPSLSLPVVLRPGSLDESTYPVTQGVFYAMGRSTPIVVSDGARKSGQSQVIVGVDTLADLASVTSVVADAGVLLLNIPTSLGYGQDSCYIAVGDMKVTRRSTIAADPYRDITLPFTIVDRPEGGSQSERTYADVLAAYSTYAAVRAAYPTYAALLAGP